MIKNVVVAVAGVDSGSKEGGTVTWRVAVVGWEWYRWKEEIGAVRMPSK
jgi:hypothetical protein